VLGLPSIMTCSLHHGVLPPSWRAPSIVAYSLHHGVLPPSWHAPSIMACSLHHGVLPPSWCVPYNSVEAAGKFSIYGSHTHASNSLEVGYRHRNVHTNKACDLVPRLHPSLSIYLVCTICDIHTYAKKSGNPYIWTLLDRNHITYFSHDLFQSVLSHNFS